MNKIDELNKGYKRVPTAFSAKPIIEQASCSDDKPHDEKQPQAQTVAHSKNLEEFREEIKNHDAICKTGEIEKFINSGNAAIEILPKILKKAKDAVTFTPLDHSEVENPHAAKIAMVYNSMSAQNSGRIFG